MLKGLCRKRVKGRVWSMDWVVGSVAAVIAITGMSVREGLCLIWVKIALPFMSGNRMSKRIKRGGL